MSIQVDEDAGYILYRCEKILPTVKTRDAVMSIQGALQR